MTLKTLRYPYLTLLMDKQALGDQSKINEYYLIKLIGHLAAVDMINRGLEFTSTLLIGACSQK